MVIRDRRVIVGVNQIKLVTSQWFDLFVFLYEANFK